MANIQVKTFQRITKSGKISQVNSFLRKHKVPLTLATATTTASIIGISAAKYLVYKNRHINNLTNVGRELEPSNSGKKINKAKLAFTIGGFGNLDNNRNITTYQHTKDLANFLNKNITTVKGIPIDKGYYMDKVYPKPLDKISYSLKTFFNNVTANNNGLAKSIAEDVYSYSLKNPKKPIYLVGYSSGGNLSRDVQFILKKKKVKTKVITIGSPDFRLVDNKNNLNIYNNQDPIIIARSKKATFIKGKGHELETYLENPDTKKHIKQYIK